MLGLSRLEIFFKMSPTLPKDREGAGARFKLELQTNIAFYNLCQKDIGVCIPSPSNVKMQGKVRSNFLCNQLIEFQQSSNFLFLSCGGSGAKAANFQRTLGWRQYFRASQSLLDGFLNFVLNFDWLLLGLIDPWEKKS